MIAHSWFGGGSRSDDMAEPEDMSGSELMSDDHDPLPLCANILGASKEGYLVFGSECAEDDCPYAHRPARHVARAHKECAPRLVLGRGPAAGL